MNKKKIFCFDIDGIICRTIDSNYIKAKPNFKTIKLINELYKKIKLSFLHQDTWAEIKIM